LNVDKVGNGLGKEGAAGMIGRRAMAIGFACVIAAEAVLGPAGARAQGAATLTTRDRDDLARIETYLNGLRTLKARFLQVAPDGHVTEGTAWLERPGRMRFQYEPPAPFLLVASRGVLVFDDSALKQTSSIPLSRTPLGILLADRVTLSGEITVTGIRRLPGELEIDVTRTSSPGEGALTLQFTDGPLALRQWTVRDAQRRETRVTLYNVEIGAKFDPKLFDDLPAQRQAAPGGGG